MRKFKLIYKCDVSISPNIDIEKIKTDILKKIEEIIDNVNGELKIHFDCFDMIGDYVWLGNIDDELEEEENEEEERNAGSDNSA